MCPAVAAPLNGSVEYSAPQSAEYPFSTIATFGCEEGYGLVGPRTSTCQDDGYFEQSPICEGT